MISTGLQKLDEILSGGIPSSVITDIYGASGTGKTQLLLQICINAAKKGENVLFLDTTGGFRPERILEMQKRQNIEEEILDKIAALVTAAFGLIAALAWNDAIKTIFREVFGEESTIGPMLLYAIIVTIIAVILTIIVARAVANAKNK